VGICCRTATIAAVALLCGAPLARAQAADADEETGRAVASFVRVIKENAGFVEGIGSGGLTAQREPTTVKIAPLTTFPRPHTEARILAHYIFDSVEAPKIGVLHPNDVAGRDYVDGLRAGLGDGAGRLLLRVLAYDPAQPGIDALVVQLRGADANVLVDFAPPEIAAQVVRKTAELGWAPIHVVTSAAALAGVTGKGLVAAHYLKLPSDPQWRTDAEVQAWRAWLRQYFPDAGPNDPLYLQGYAAGHVLVPRLKGGGADARVPMLLPGIAVAAEASSEGMITRMQMMGFSGDRWQTIGPVLGPGLPPSAARKP